MSEKFETRYLRLSSDSVVLFLIKDSSQQWLSPNGLSTSVFSEKNRCTVAKRSPDNSLRKWLTALKPHQHNSNVSRCARDPFRWLHINMKDAVFPKAKPNNLDRSPDGWLREFCNAFPTLCFQPTSCCPSRTRRAGIKMQQCSLWRRTGVREVSSHIFIL